MNSSTRGGWLVALCLGLAVSLSGLSDRSDLAKGEDESRGRKLAFLVGVNEYDHAQMPPLRFPENDVSELAVILRKQNFEVVLLTSAEGKKNRPLKPTAENIQRELSRLLKKATRHDLIVVGLAGHGIQPLGSERAYFLPQDGNPTTKAGKQANDPSFAAFPETLVSIDETLETLGNSGIGQTVMLVDACRNDPGVRGRRGVDRVRVQALPSNTAVLLSCSPGQFAFEHESWGVGGHGAFFSQVIEGMRGAAADEAGRVTWDDLARHLRKRVPALVRKTYGKDGGDQQPNIITNTSGEPLALATVARRTLASPENLPGFGQGTTSGTKTSSSESNPPAFTNSLGMKLVLIPQGRFQMGSTESDNYAREDERPQHLVMITNAFYMGKYEVTRGEFRKFVRAARYKTEKEKKGEKYWGYSGDVKSPFALRTEFGWENPGFTQTDDRPVVNVTWNEATLFCNWLSRQEGKKYRLPTEAEWEYACRAGTTTRWNGTSEEGNLQRIANIADLSLTTKDLTFKGAATWNDGHPFTAPSGGFPANEFGLQNMHGNVWEWCNDKYSDKYYADSPTENPQGPETDSEPRVLRGGSWNSVIRNTRSATRFKLEPNYEKVNVGFRVVRDISP